jgi:excinuclease ABC subunit A
LRSGILAFQSILIKGAREHNLKNIDLELPRNCLIAITGVSGSGKSSLAFDTIYAEGQRRYIESLSTYSRQFIEKLGRPELDDISGISPTIAIRQKNTVTSARSTVGTSTEIYDYLRLLFARVGKIICPHCGVEVKSYSAGEVSDIVMDEFSGRRVYLLMPLAEKEGEEWKSSRSYLLSRGYTRLLIGKHISRVDEMEQPPSGDQEVFVLLDRVTAELENRFRITESVELAYREDPETVIVEDAQGDKRLRFTQTPSCLKCGRFYHQPTPLLFSFNNPYGACPECRGFGDKMEFSEEFIVPDRGLSIRERAIDPWSRERFEHFQRRLMEFCKRRDIPVDVPWKDMEECDRDVILEGGQNYIGVIPFLEKMKKKSYKKGHRFFTRRYMGYTTCRACRGRRLRKEAFHVKIAGRDIGDVNVMIPSEILSFLDGCEFTDRESIIVEDILAELKSRLEFMIEVGLDYLTLDRLTRTLSGGEAQRINLANALGANLVDAVYILDEPSIGMHAADNRKLISVVKKLRDRGNTVIIVEHDPDIIRSCDYIVDLGPGPGTKGGQVVFSGTAEEAERSDIEDSRTLDWIFRARGKVKGRGATGQKIKERREGGRKIKGKAVKQDKRNRALTQGEIILKGANLHNLKNINVDFPMGCMVCVTGVSGSGKSSLVVDTLYKALSRKSSARYLDAQACLVRGRMDRALLVDQSPIGTTPRSNPVTYIKAFSMIREAFAGQRESIARGYKQGRFSFNKPEGRCSRCSGMGYRRVEMHFMADIFVPCEVCGSKRYNRETLEILYKNKNISEVLELTVDEAIMFFSEMPRLGEKLWVLSRVGLGYLKLGQPANTLSGGESQRMKIARELARSMGEKNVYIMDEPTTGLHMSDVHRLIIVLDELVRNGHTVVIIEHNMEIIRSADYLIDMGPGGGEWGGGIVAHGSPEKIMEADNSLTGKYLRDYLKKQGMEE